MHLSLAFVGALLSTSAFGAIQAPNLSQSSTAATRQQQVKEAFEFAYSGYLQYGFPNDEVTPVTNGSDNPRNGWGATAVDSLTTMLTMGLTDLYSGALAHTLTIDFSVSKTPDTVSIFETTIRYLGAMVSAYEYTGAKDKALLAKAVELGDKLTFGWSKGSGVVPYGFLDFSTDSPVVRRSNVAEAGTLLIEFDRLSFHSGNDTYRRLAASSNLAIINGPQVLPGLPGQGIDPGTAKPTDAYATWGGGTDSFLEYNIKYPQLVTKDTSIYQNYWAQSIDSSIQHLIKKSSVKDLTYLSDYENGTSYYVWSHLGCFAPGNWLLGAKILDNSTIYDYGVALAETCYNSYATTATRIGPEVFNYLDSIDSASANLTSAQRDFYNTAGMYINNAPYFILRPEVVESYFYAYRITGDTIWQDRAWEAFEALQKYCRTPIGFSTIDNVNSPTPSQTDNEESFFYAELMKYHYLIQSPPDLLSLDEYVFNTEAHPFRIGGAAPSAGGYRFVRARRSTVV